MKNFLATIALVLMGWCGFTQVVPEDINNTRIYDLLDELASLKLITLNQVVRPYSRIYIAEKLAEAGQAIDSGKFQNVSGRIDEEIRFFSADYLVESAVRSGENPGMKVNSPAPRRGFGYDPVGYSFTGHGVALAIRPVIQAQSLINGNGNVRTLTGGGDFFCYLGSHVSLYARYKQTWQSEPLVTQDYFSTEEGKVWRELNNGSVSSLDWRGGLSVAWKWGDLGVFRDRPVWGNAQHGSNILSGHAPAFPFVKLHLKPAKWFEFNYIAGILQSNYSDTVGSQSEGIRIKEFDKYIFANMLTVTPWKSLNVTVGNSVIHGGQGLNPVYFIPFLFYKSADQSLTSLSSDNGQNNQLFFCISFTPVRHLNLYTSVFIDDLKMDALLTKGLHNEISSKIGLVLSDLPFKNLVFTCEYTRTNPLTYNHYVPTITFYSDNYCLGSYMRDDSQELFIRLSYKPRARIVASVEYIFSQHGSDYTNIRYLKNYELPVLQDIHFDNHEVALKLQYSIWNRFIVFSDMTYRNRQGDIKYTPDVLRGKTYTLTLGFNLGF